MAINEDKIAFALRGAKGITLYNGVTDPKVRYDFQVVDPANDVRAMQFSNTGKYLAFCNSIDTYLIETSTGEVLIKYPLPKPTYITFSPKDTMFVAWELYCIYGRRRNEDGTVRTPNPNINFFSVTEKKHVKTIIGKRKENVPQWTQDEKYMVMIVGGEVLVYEGGELEKSKFKAAIPDVHTISVSTHQNDHFFAVFTPSLNGNPARVDLRRIGRDLPVFSSATFMNCDKIQMQWNSKGTAMLALATVDVDKTGKSYYGNSFLQLLSFNGEKCRVSFDKEGSVHDVKWSPTGSHFAAVYGLMPAKTTVYNVLGNPVWELGESHYNEIHFNAQGNLLAQCGFGAITSGKIRIWKFEEHREICNIEVPNTQYFEFSADGQHFYTATTAPRMRIENCYRLWRYTGEQLFEHAPYKNNGPKFELWEVKWQPSIEDSCRSFTVTEEDKSKTGIKITVEAKNGTMEVAAGSVKKAGAYVPPHLRKAGSQQGALKPVGVTVVAAQDLDKQIKKLEGNLRAIEKLKDRKKRGESLEKNQLEKLERESQVRDELEKLKASAA